MSGEIAQVESLEERERSLRELLGALRTHSEDDTIKFDTRLLASLVDALSSLLFSQIKFIESSVYAQMGDYNSANERLASVQNSVQQATSAIQLILDSAIGDLEKKDHRE